MCGAGNEWPEEVIKIRYHSAADDSEQPAMFYKPQTDGPVPLLVALHTWSNGYNQREPQYARWCIEHGWIMIHPHFRGPNTRPEATGSPLVVQDILSAVQYAREVSSVDEQRIYLVGVSGGGYTALQMAGRAPDIWAGVSAWAGISDLAAWYRECLAAKRGYYKHVVASCGGAPGDSDVVDAEYAQRSPLTHLHNATNVPLDIATGIHDGHKGSVPVSHSLLAFNAVARPEDRIAADDVRHFVERRAVPPNLQQTPEALADPDYGKRQVLFRRSSGNVRVTIFEGGHEIIHDAALRWLSRQCRR
jgi:dipeptidyl aminopeptidase/acylaminoacyl peptidase